MKMYHITLLRNDEYSNTSTTGFTSYISTTSNLYNSL
nr:MAG TPA: hypothetical protein [Caudoviricetes sp.]